VICPKCGFSQPDDYYCASCGVNVHRFVQKRKKRGYAVGIAIVFLGVVAIAITRYVQTSYRFEKTETISKTEDEKRGSAAEQTARMESRIQRSESTERSSERRVTRRTTPQGAPTASRTATKALSERGIAGTPPETTEGEVESRQKQTQFTARQWFEKGRALDDDSEPEIESYRKAIELDPKFAPAYYHLGAIYYRQAEYERAEAEFVKFLQYASDEERLEYDMYLYYSDADLEGLIEEGRQASRAQEEASTETGPETGPEEAEEAGLQGGGETEEEVQTIVRFSSHQGQILVPVVLNGSVTTDVLLDTGSSMTIISTELARELGLKVARDRTIRLRTIAAEVQAFLARLDYIELGNLRRRNFPVAVSDLKLGEQRKFDGILGMDFLNNYAIQIDNKDSRILLSPSSNQ
jgi:clan AA aspartic protease (TIGR02281 family)